MIGQNSIERCAARNEAGNRADRDPRSANARLPTFPPILAIWPLK
jgi:hypothetical protein